MRLFSTQIILLLAMIFSLFTFGCIHLYVPNIVAAHILPLVPGGQTIPYYEQLPVNTTHRVYMFNIKNYEEFVNSIEPPHVEQLGPYTFRSVNRRDLYWKQGQLLFREARRFYFVPELSKGRSLNDEVVTVNISHRITTMETPQRIEEQFIKRTVRELLFEGYEDSLLKEIYNGKRDSPLVHGKFGAFLGQNASSHYTFTVNSGANGNLDKLNIIQKFKNAATLPYYDKPCNELRGTTGERFPPFLGSPPPSLDVFFPKLCRPIRLYRNRTVTLENLQSEVFTSGEEGIFTKTGDTNIDRCYEEGAFYKGVDGTFDASACTFDFPVVYSLPHFYKASPILRHDVHGLTPDPEKHEFTLSVSDFGITTDFAVRVQANFPIRGNDREILYPLYWSEMILLDEDRKKLAKFIYDETITPQNKINIGLIATPLFAIAFVYFVVRFYLKYKKSIQYPVCNDIVLWERSISQKEISSSSSVKETDAPELVASDDYLREHTQNLFFWVETRAEGEDAASRNT